MKGKFLAAAAATALILAVPALGEKPADRPGDTHTGGGGHGGDHRGSGGTPGGGGMGGPPPNGGMGGDHRGGSGGTPGGGGMGAGAHGGGTSPGGGASGHPGGTGGPPPNGGMGGDHRGGGKPGGGGTMPGGNPFGQPGGTGRPQPGGHPGGGSDTFRHRGDLDGFRRDFRAPHRRFHGGSYHRPNGWYAHRWSFGDFLPALFFGSSYWLNDYDSYDLPRPPRGTVWVRYGNDALLVDRRTGEVITVAYGIFY